jgi:hypothetical protein
VVVMGGVWAVVKFYFSKKNEKSAPAPTIRRALGRNDRVGSCRVCCAPGSAFLARQAAVSADYGSVAAGRDIRNSSFNWA